jgi:hypothetical protein
VVQIRHQQSSSLEVNDAIAASLYLFERSVVDGDGWLRRHRRWCGRVLACCPPLGVAVEGHSAVFGVHCPIVPQQQVAPHKRAPAFEALERPFLGV